MDNLTGAAHRSVANVMRWVAIALIPGLAVFIYQTGWGGVLNVLIACMVAIAAEAIAAKVQGRGITATIGDYSAIVTALLLALCLPPLLPWWITALATIFAILLGKQIYGGLGQNIFNPAMAGYALILISYPLDISSWPLLPDAFRLSLADTITLVFNGGLSQSPDYDAMTGATALSQVYDLALRQTSPTVIKDTVQGYFGAHHSEWINAAYVLSGLLLINLRIITWHLPVAVIFGLSFGHLVLGTNYPDLTFHLFGGATMLCAFFIVTDPVTAPVSRRGRLVFGFFIGLLIFLIRHYGGYPEGVAFAVLIMNCCVPAIDRLDAAINESARP